MSELLIARPQVEIPGFAGAWRVLCGKPRCSGELARLALVRWDAGSPDVCVTPVLPAHTARDAHGVWRQSTRRPRRPFRSGIDGVPARLTAPLMAEMAEEPARVKMLLPLRMGPAGPLGVDVNAGLVIACPRCRMPSALRAADIWHALSALEQPWQLWEEVRAPISTR